MPITFAQAKAQICPDRNVVPGSKDHQDILELMRQSGMLYPEDMRPKAVEYARTIPQFNKRFGELTALEKPQARKGISKNEWLSIDVHRKAYDEHIRANQQIPIGSMEPLPDHLDWQTKIAPKVKHGMSKKEWIALLK